MNGVIIGMLITDYKYEKKDGKFIKFPLPYYTIKAKTLRESELKKMLMQKLEI